MNGCFFLLETIPRRNRSSRFLDISSCQVFVSVLIPHLLIGLLPFALALAALQVKSTNNQNHLFVIIQVFFSRSKCQVRPHTKIRNLEEIR